MQNLAHNLRMEKFRSYAFTIRPSDGVTDKQIEKFVKWARKASEYYHVITEKTGSERHVHAAIFLKNAATRSNVVTQVMRMYDDLSSSEKRVLRNGIRIMYNRDFIEKYCDKNDDTVIIASSLPEAGHMESYFPPKPQPKVSAAKRCSVYYHELESLWFEYNSPSIEVNSSTCRDFLFNVMYNKRVLPVIRDDKQIIQVARHLTRWLNKVSHSTIELPPFEKEE